MPIIYQSSHPNISNGIQSYGMNVPYITPGDSVVIDEILECCRANGVLLNKILSVLRLRGFRTEKPTRKELQLQNQEILNELRTLKRLIQRNDELPGGGYNGPKT